MEDKEAQFLDFNSNIYCNMYILRKESTRYAKFIFLQSTILKIFFFSLQDVHFRRNEIFDNL